MKQIATKYSCKAYRNAKSSGRVPNIFVSYGGTRAKSVVPAMRAERFTRVGVVGCCERTIIFKRGAGNFIDVVGEVQEVIDLERLTSRGRSIDTGGLEMQQRWRLHGFFTR